jgi:hypothetical protein
MSVEIQSAYMIHPRMTHSLSQLSVQSPALFMVHSELRYVDVTAARVLPALAWTMHEGTAFHGHACKFGDVEA